MSLQQGADARTADRCQIEMAGTPRFAMIFVFFQKSRQNSAQNEFDLMLSMSDARYADTILTFYEGMDVATRAHILVAYPNLVPILSALHIHAKEQRKTYTVEDYGIRGLAIQKFRR